MMSQNSNLIGNTLPNRQKSDRNEIVLVGPMGSGKTSVGRYLSEKLDIPLFSMDDIKWYFLLRNGYNPIRAKKILQEEGFARKMDYFYEHFGYNEVRQILQTFSNGIFDFGATHSYHNDPSNFDRIRRLLSSFENVFLLMPAFDHDLSGQILRERLGERYRLSGLGADVIASYSDYNLELMRAAKFESLANYTIITQNKSIELVGLEILSRSAGVAF